MTPLQCQKSDETFQTFEEQNVTPMFNFVFNCDIFLFVFSQIKVCCFSYSGSVVVFTFFVCVYIFVLCSSFLCFHSPLLHFGGKPCSKHHRKGKWYVLNSGMSKNTLNYCPKHYKNQCEYYNISPLIGTPTKMDLFI